jgi:hypothetical protein
MGDHIFFRINQGAACQHSMFDEDDELVESMGMAYFSGFTANAQKKVYGVNYIDCLTWGPEGEETEMVGPPDSEGVHGWYTPDWDRALARVDRLVAAWEQTTNEHRKEYDNGKVHNLRDIIHRCAAHPQRQHIQVCFS